MQRLAGVEPGEPQAVPAGVGRDQGRGRAAGELDVSPGCGPSRGRRRRPRAARRPTSPGHARRRAGEAQLELRAVARGGPATAAGSVAELLTTSRSPGSSSSGSSRKLRVREAAVAAASRPSAGPRRARARAPRAARVPRARPGGRRRERSRAAPGRDPPPGSGRSAASPSISAQQAGHALLRRRAVGDVLAGERLLVHAGAHVAGVDGVDAQLRVLGGEHRAELLERGLGGAVAAPAGVRLDPGVGGDVEDAAAGARLRQREPGRGRAERARSPRRRARSSASG